MDPNMPGPKHIQSQMQQQYTQSPTNILSRNGKQQYLNRLVPGYQSAHHMGRNIATIGPISSKSHHMEQTGETAPEMFAQNQIMCSGIMKYECESSAVMQNYPRGSVVSQQQQQQQHQQPMNMPNYQSGPSSSPIMMAGGGGAVRGSSIPMHSHQEVFNQIGNPLPLEMASQAHQQRFHPTGSRFPQHPQFNEDIVMMSDGSGMSNEVMLNCRGVPIVPTTYDGFAGTQQQQPLNCKPMGTPQTPMPPQLAAPPNEGNGLNPTSQAQFIPQAPPPLTNSMNPASISMNQRPANIEMISNYQQNTVCNPQLPMGGRFPGPSQMQMPIRGPLKSLETSGLSMMSPQPIPIPAQGTQCAHCRNEVNAPCGGDKPLGSRQHFPPIQCEAGCLEWFHLVCSGLTPDAFFLLKGEPFAEWLCTPCATRAYPNIPYTRIRT